MYQRHKSIISIVLLTLILGVSAVSLSAQSHETCPIGGFADEGAACGFQINTHVSYPTWLGESEIAHDAVSYILTRVISEFSMTHETFSGHYFTSMELDIEFTEYAQGDLRSIVFTVYAYTGGAHGLTTYESATVNVVDNTQLALWGDVFPDAAAAISVLQPLVVAELQETIGDYSDEEAFLNGTDESTDYYAWAITEDELIIFFPPYQVAPYVAGAPQVSIPLSAVAAVINPAYLP